MKFTIDRERWSRGGDPEPKLVRSTDGKMCCLGFFLLACGVSREELLDKDEPQEPFQAIFHEAEILEPARVLVNVEHDDGEDDEDGHEDFDVCLSDEGASFIEDNDDPSLDEDERERRIAGRFAKHGHEVTFVGEARTT